MFKRIGAKEELCVFGVYDASYHNDYKSVAGEMIMLGNKNTDKMSPLYWKSKQIQNVCHSAKETMNAMKMVDNSLYLKQQLAVLWFK